METKLEKTTGLLTSQLVSIAISKPTCFNGNTVNYSSTLMRLFLTDQKNGLQDNDIPNFCEIYKNEINKTINKQK